MRPGPGTLLHDVSKDLTIAPAPGVLPVGRLVGVVGQIQVAELVDLAVLHPAEPGEVGFRQVVRGAVIGPILQLVIHPASVVPGMQGIVGVVLVGADHRAQPDIALGQAGYIGLVLVLEHEGQRLRRAGRPGAGQFLALLPHDEDAALGRFLVLGQATVDPLALLVLRPNMAVHISAVHLDLAG